MAIAFETPRAETGILLLADISGFTSFLEAVAVAHPEMLRSGGEAPPAYRVLSSLLDVVVARIEPAFTLANVEEDAVFAYGLGDGMAGNAEGVLDTVPAAHGASASASRRPWSSTGTTVRRASFSPRLSSSSSYTMVRTSFNRSLAVKRSSGRR